MIKPARSLFLVLAVVSLAVACDDGGDEAPAPVDMARDTLPPMLRDMNTGAVDATVDAAVPVADISIEPRSLMLLADVGEASAPGALTLSNVGTAPLTVQAVTLTPADGPFRLEPAPALPATLMPGERLMVSVIYQPQDEGPHSATLAVVSDDPDEGMISLMVNGRVRETCIRAMPGSVNLGTVEPGGESGRFRVQVANCGDRPIEVQAVRLDGADDFQWATERGDDPTGLVLRAGDLLLIQVWYTNNNLPPGEAAQTVLVIETDAPTAPSLRVNVRAEGGAGPGCAVVLDPGMLDFDILRTGLTRSMEVTVRNDGSGECALRSVSVQRDSGPEENTYTVTRGLEGDVLAPRSAQTIEVTYAPTVANPLGDRSTLRVAYHDAERGLNLAQEALLRGQGATALVGALPEELVFVRTTAPDCASPPLTVDAANVGFVPICLTGYDREGDGCPSFVFVDPPAIDACHALDRDEALPLQLVFQPSAPGEVTCDIIVRSDAQNTEALHIPLRGEGVAEAATVDTHLVPMLDARNPARFSLSRPAVERTVRVFEDDALNEDWDFDAQRNAVSFPRGRHPAEGATLRIEYDAICFDRR